VPPGLTDRRRLGTALAVAAVGALLLAPLPVDTASAPPQYPAAQTDYVPVRSISARDVGLPPPEQSAGERRFSFIAYGDTRSGVDGSGIQPGHSLVVDAMIAAIARQRTTDFPVRFVVQSGDAVNNGRFGRQWNVSFVPIIERLISAGRVPYFFAVGNHDVGTMPSANDPLRRIGVQNTADAMKALWPADRSPQRLRGYPTYWFAYGQVFVLVIDSNIAGDRRQLEWVTAQLEQVDRARYRHIVAVFHHPALSSGPHGGATVEPQTDLIRRLYMPLFRRFHVGLLLTGHDHLFDHFVERYDDESGTHRIDHVISAGGGAPIYSYVAEPDLVRYAQTALPQAVRVEHLARPGATEADNPYHFALITVDGDALSLQVIPVSGTSLTPYNGSDTTALDN
jgi:hypothetical protein